MTENEQLIFPMLSTETWGGGNRTMPNWVLVVDDDITNLKMAGAILSKNGMRVTALKSGQALLDFLEKRQ